MRYLRKFENFDNLKYDIDGILCQLKDIGINYELSNYKDLIIINIDKNDKNSEFQTIVSQLDDYMTNLNYNSKVVDNDLYRKYYIPKDSYNTIDKSIALYSGISALYKINRLYGDLRD